MIAGILLPVGAYSAAAEALVYADGMDGDAAITRAEALSHEGGVRSERIRLYRQGLTQAPALVRGWSLLALDEATMNSSEAVLALDQALLLAPNDFWVAGMRSQGAAMLWEKLDADTRTLALAQVRLLWDEPLLRPQLYKLLGVPGGPALVSVAFAARRSDLIELNRWASAQARAFVSP